MPLTKNTWKHGKNKLKLNKFVTILYTFIFLQMQPFGLNNTGAICYFNALTQSLLSCTSITKIIQNFSGESELNGTLTGKAFINAFLTALSTDRVDVSNISSKLLHALITDIKGKNTFGKMQESASEGLVLLLDAMENPDSKEHPITKLFQHEYNVKLFCNKCKDIVSEQKDFGIDINLFFQDRLDKMSKPEDFVDAIYQHISPLDNDYVCPKCKTRTNGIRLHTLRYAPEIMVCKFMVYNPILRKMNYFPIEMKFPGTGNNVISYKLVAQIEHSGSLEGGHYWCRARRGDDKIYNFDDTNVGSASFSSSSGTYMLFYQRI